MIEKINKLTFYGLLNFLILIPMGLRIYGKFFFDNLLFGISFILSTLIILPFLYVVLTNKLKKNKSNDENLAILILSIFLFFLIIYITISIFSEPVVFGGNLNLKFAVISYIVYFFMHLFFLVSFSIKFYKVYRFK
ncbi:MAG: hypothetical protein COS19_07850 [Flavobacteriaceae bacterium CG02_land_8_20_14_3_00_34_13]|nr:MAG: hypothetical protein COS19_07850 [Flavobacteriaceae bacterium CG02_land_8_20_14_3_00_34_13]